MEVAADHPEYLGYVLADDLFTPLTSGWDIIARGLLDLFDSHMIVQFACGCYPIIGQGMISLLGDQWLPDNRWDCWRWLDSLGHDARASFRPRIKVDTHSHVAGYLDILPTEEELRWYEQTGDRLTKLVRSDLKARI